MIAKGFVILFFWLEVSRQHIEGDVEINAGQEPRMLNH